MKRITVHKRSGLFMCLGGEEKGSVVTRVLLWAA